MRVFIAALVLIFSFQSTVLGEVQIDNLFGVKIFDNVKKYSNKNKGVGLRFVFSSTILNSFLASSLRLNIGLTNMYSTSASSLYLTKPVSY